jgi:hypothetical protein
VRPGQPASPTISPKELHGAANPYRNGPRTIRADDRRLTRWSEGLERRRQVVGIAQAVTGQSAPDAALAAIQADPNLSMQFQKAVLEPQAQLAADVETAQLAADQANTAVVNQTMQVGAKADYRPTYAWRPFVGFCFGFAWIGA